MTARTQNPDWLWPLPGQETKTQSDESDALAHSFARVFRGHDGAKVLAYLRAVTIERRTQPDASGRTLRHLEGQRHLVALVEHWIARGRGRAAGRSFPTFPAEETEQNA